MTYPLEHKIIRPSKWDPSPNVAETFRRAREKGPLVGGPVSVVQVAPFDLNHPLHSRHACYIMSIRQRAQ
jgi:hypothetical protein